MRDPLLVEELRLGRALHAFGQRAVGERELSFGYADAGRGRLLLRGIVEAREPVARVGVLRLGPDVFGLALDEVQSAARVLDGVPHIEGQRFAGAQRRFERDLERLAGRPKRQRAAVRSARDRGDVEVAGVEDEPRDAVLDRPHRGYAVRVEPLALDIGPQVEVDVEDVDELVGSVLQSRTRQREGAVVAHRARTAVRVASFSQRRMRIASERGSSHQVKKYVRAGTV